MTIEEVKRWWGEVAEECGFTVAVYERINWLISEHDRLEEENRGLRDNWVQAERQGMERAADIVRGYEWAVIAMYGKRGIDDLADKIIANSPTVPILFSPADRIGKLALDLCRIAEELRGGGR